VNALKPKILFFLLAVVLILAVGCTKYPEEELSNAEEAIAKAEDAGAKEYAETRLESARELLREAREQIEAKDFGAAQKKAMEAYEKATAAEERATTQKLKLKKDVESAIQHLNATLEAKIGSGEITESDLESAKNLINKAQVLHDSGEFKEAKRKIDAARVLLDVSAAPKPAEPETPEPTEPEEEMESAPEDTGSAEGNQ
jgi:tetratricopeptide (TPR) repeat protein